MTIHGATMTAGVADVPGLAVLQHFASSEAAVGVLRPAEPVYCLYPTLLAGAARQFLDGFPGRVMYAVKANPDPNVLRVLHGAGIRHFDTASLAEIELVKRLFPQAECHFMAPSKLVGAAEAAFRDFGVRHFVADHPSELDRLLAIADAETAIHIRMKAFDPESVYELSSKFGADERLSAQMLARVAASGCRPGLAFNVGSLCRHPDAYRRALAAAGRVLDESKVHIRYLDVGGGFPAAYPGLAVRPLPEFFAAIREAAGTLALPADCELMCEPGRALVAAGQSVIVQVILVKDDLVFLNDGIYGSFQEIQVSKNLVTYPLRVIRPGGQPSAALRQFSVSGPTCDTLDVLPGTVDLPQDIAVGDWIEFGSVGAYSNAMATRFNGFEPRRWVVVDGAAALPPGPADV
jgi:ornithine decarboxylase